MTLTEVLLAEGRRQLLIADCVRLLEEEIDSKKGISGLTIKTVFKLVQKIKSNVFFEIVDHLLPSFSQALDPFYQTFQKEKQQAFESFLLSQPDAVVKALLSVTDAKAQNAENKILKAGYENLRGVAEHQVMVAIPKIAMLLSKYTSLS